MASASLSFFRSPARGGGFPLAKNGFESEAITRFLDAAKIYKNHFS